MAKTFKTCLQVQQSSATQSQSIVSCSSPSTRSSSSSSAASSSSLTTTQSNGRKTREILKNPLTCQTTPASQSDDLWRLCWNGEQLDSDLLYRTAKARQERRLMAAAAAATRPDRPEQQVVYAVPRNDRGHSLHRKSHSAANGSSAPAPGPIVERSAEHPLDDPLYASVLGTSKHLRAARESSRKRQQVDSAATTAAATAAATTNKQPDESHEGNANDGYATTATQPTDNNDDDEQRLRAILETCLGLHYPPAKRPMSAVESSKSAKSDETTTTTTTMLQQYPPTPAAETSRLDQV